MAQEVQYSPQGLLFLTRITSWWTLATTTTWLLRKDQSLTSRGCPHSPQPTFRGATMAIIHGRTRLGVSCT
jgi:hypothetical protein